MVCVGGQGVLALPGIDNIPEPLGLVNDFAGVLTEAEIEEIEAVARQLWTGNGVELALVTVAETAPLDTDLYAYYLFQQWGMGQKGEDKGLLVLLNVDERQVRIEVGLGLEADVNDAKAGRILDAAIPDLRENRFGAGLLVISRELSAAVREVPGEGRPVDKDAYRGPGPIGTMLLIYLGLIVFAVVFRRQGLLQALLRFPTIFFRGRGGGGGFGGYGGGGGGFGGFGGGRSGGGGASRKF